MARFWVLYSKDHLHGGQANDQGWSYEARSATASSGILGVRVPLGAVMSPQNTQINFGAPNSLRKPQRGQILKGVPGWGRTGCQPSEESIDLGGCPG